MKTRLLAQIADLGPPAAGEEETAQANKILSQDEDSIGAAAELCLFLASAKSGGLSGKLVSAQWDDYRVWPEHLSELKGSELYALRRITCRDRGLDWGDK
jgi:3-oxoacyl-[acyl-carrier protein] reductase